MEVEKRIKCDLRSGNHLYFCYIYGSLGFGG